MLCDVRRRLADPTMWSLAGVVLAAALLRFSDLGARSFWRDEGATVELVRRSFVSMLRALPGSEGTPPLYYVLIWPWSRVFGSDEVGLRSFSALVGTATVLVVYAIAAELVSNRAALVAAGLSAVSPLLVWHSQDARSYALLVLFSSLSFLLFVRSLRAPTVRTLTLWALASSLALATHYFALFAVAPEALWLAVSAGAGRSSRVVWATAGIAVVGAALTPLALAQRSNGAWIKEVPRGHRIYEVGENFLVGPQAPRPKLLSGLAGLLVLIGFALFAAYGRERERRMSAIAGGIGASALLLPLLLSLAGLDYVLARNLIVAWVPFVMLVAAGLAVRGAALIAAPTLCALLALAVTVDVATAHKPKFRAEDWRSAARAVGPAGPARAIVVVPDAGIYPLLAYRTGARSLPANGARVREVVVVAIGPSRHELGRGGDYPLPPASLFQEVERRDGRYFTLLRFRSPTRRFVTPATLGIGRPGLRLAAGLLDGPPAGSPRR